MIPRRTTYPLPAEDADQCECDFPANSTAAGKDCGQSSEYHQNDDVSLPNATVPATGKWEVKCGADGYTAQRVLPRWPLVEQIGVTSCVAAIGVLAVGKGRLVAAGSAPARVSTLSLVRLYIYC